MEVNENANWWAFSIDEQQREKKIRNGPEGLRDVNPELPDGRLALDYQTYVGLERLLTCQVPSSRVPDERVFIITHQLFEVVFKLMIFDLAVISTAFKHLLAISDDAEFHSRCTLANESSFWRPALTAAARLKYSSRVLLPAFIGYLAESEGKDETFASLEFYKFREYLPPASGFQTAQFRLIQRALGKANLFTVRLFPAQKYNRYYGGVPGREPVRVVDSLILRAGVRTALPEGDTPLAAAAEADDLGHRVLARLSRFREPKEPEVPVARIEPAEIEAAVESFQRILAAHRKQREKAGGLPADAGNRDRHAESVFRQDMEKAAGMENKRRQPLEKARTGAIYLHHIAPGGHLAQVLNRIIATDDALHGAEEESFLAVHYRMAAQRVRDMSEYARKTGNPEPPAGTGGGGIPYLWLMRKNLIPLFPALIAFRDVADSRAFGWIE